jgi:hypothetical protein
MVVRLTVYSDIDEGRAAAERLAASRGVGAFQWAIQDSNLGPLPYQRSALTI